MSGRIFFKKHRSERGDIIAMCDEELLGKEFQEGKKKLDLKRYASFYKGDLVERKAIDIDIENIYSANVVGENSVKLFIEKGIVDSGSVKEIDGIKFIQIYSVIN